MTAVPSRIQVNTIMFVLKSNCRVTFSFLKKRPKFRQEVKGIYLIFHLGRGWVGVEGWWNLPCLPYLLFNYSSCFQWEEKPADTLASLNLEKAAAPPLPICLHDVKPATGYWLSHMRALMGRNPESQPVHARLRLFTRSALFPGSDQRGGSPRCTQICLHPAWGRRGSKHRSRFISALFFFIGLQIDSQGGVVGGESSMQAVP